MSVKTVVLSSIILITRTSSRMKSFKVHFLSVIANEAADPRGSAVELANHRAVHEY